MNLVSEYLQYLAHECTYSVLTVQNYARDLDTLTKLAGDVPFAEIKAPLIRRFVAMLHSQGLGGKSIARKLSAWRGFYKFLSERHGVEHNPCVGMRAPKSPKHLPAALSAEQAIRMVSIDADGSLITARDRAMLEMFYSSGLRLAELVGLNCGDVDFSEGIVLVTGKGNKTRSIPVGSHALEALAAWMSMRSAIPNVDELAIFITAQGKRMTPRAVQYRFKAWSLKQGVAGDVHPHMLRHSFASHVLQSSGDLRAVQEMLGHANISTTQIYTHLDFQHLAKVYDAAHPRAKKK